MNILKSLLFVGMLAIAGPSAQAGATDPLFLNVTTDDAHRSSMAIGFGVKQMARGHALTLFLNDKGVFLASRSNAARFGEQQKAIAEVLAGGGTVMVCPMCMKHYGMKDADLVQGVRLGNPDLIGDALFRDNTRSLTW